MLPYHLRQLFNEFGHRLITREAWRGDLLMQRGWLTCEELRDAVVGGYFTTTDGRDEARYSVEEYLRAGLHFAVKSCFYRLTSLGWLTGMALGASFADPRAGVVKQGDTTGLNPVA